MNYRKMLEQDIELVVPLYIAYYNGVDGDNWTYDTTYKRIHQVVTREDSYSMIAEEDSIVMGFVMGSMEQFYDLISYSLVEIVVALEYQNRGIGTELMVEIERRVKDLGATLIQLQSEKDEMHEHFYGEKLEYKKATSFTTMTKWL